MGDALTVHGTVVALDGHPVAGAKVRIGETIALTDDRGRFRVENAPPRYDAALVRALDRAVFAFPGLTQREPTLWLYEPAPMPRLVFGTRVHVAIAEPAAPNTRTLYFAELAAPNTDGLALSVVAGGGAGAESGEADLDIRWSGTASAGLALYALRYDTDGRSADVTRYSGIASTITQLESGRPSTWRVDALAPIGTRAIVTQIEISGELDLADAVFGFQIPPSTTLTLLPVPPPSARETIELAPDLPGATIVLAALGTPLAGAQAKRAFSTARVAHAGTDDTKMSVRLSHALRLLSPEANAPRVDAGTMFTWEPSPDARTHIVHFEPELLTPVLAPDVYVQTHESSVTFPDTADLGVSFPKEATYTWQVVTPSWTPDPGTGAPQIGADNEDRVSISELRHFVMAP